MVRRIEALARQLGTTKKTVLEDAIQFYAEKIEKEWNMDVLEQMLGAWQRNESPDETIEQIRETFHHSMLG